MTPVIYGSDGRVKADGVGLEVIGDIEVTRRYWSLVYSFVPIGETGQGVVACDVDDFGFDALAFGDVLVRGHPAAIGDRLTRNRNRPPVLEMKHLAGRLR